MAKNPKKRTAKDKEQTRRLRARKKAEKVRDAHRAGVDQKDTDFLF